MDNAWEAWLPKSILALRDYDRATFRHDLIAGHHRRAGRAAAGDGVRHRVRPARPRPASTAPSSPASSSRRSAARASRSAVRPAPSSSSSPASSPQHGVAGLFMCTMMAGVMLVILGVTGDGNGGSLHPAPGRRRVHQRHRGPHREHPDSRLPRAADDRESRRVPRPPRGHLAATWTRSRPPRSAWA